METRGGGRPIETKGGGRPMKSARAKPASFCIAFKVMLCLYSRSEFPRRFFESENSTGSP